ncbi:MAG: hypothetical protein ACE5MK_11990 [Acidobacteriota bacterium]
MSRFLWSLSLVGFILLGACAPQLMTSPDLWNKPGATRIEFVRERDQCLREAIVSEVRQEEFGGTRTVKRVDHRHFHACMKSRGWEPQT